MTLELIANNPVLKNDSPPILFLHGMWHGAWCWEYFLKDFAELGYQAYAMSLSNHGQSPQKKNINFLSINDYVEDLKTVVNSLEHSPILIGHSMGGFIIQKYLEKYPAPKAVLIAPVPPYGVWAGTFKTIASFPLAFLTANLTLNLKRIISSLDTYKAMMLSKNISDSEAKRFHKKIDNESFRAYIDMLGLNLVNTKKINTAIMILGGEQDFAVPLKALKKTAEIYGVKPEVFASMGHDIMLEPDHKLIVNKIHNWLQNPKLDY